MSNRQPAGVVKQPKPNSKKNNKAIGTSMMRLQRELAEITKDPPPNCSAKLKSDNLYEWVGTIRGPKDTVYENGVFLLDIHFSPEYPFKPPQVTFRTKIYHCNIDNRQGGRICMDVLKDAWSPVLTVSKLLLSICSLMADCNPAHPLVHDIAKEYLNDRAKHDETARSWTKEHAK